jgi:RNA polymerase sigma factor (sigma-70 family)
VKSREATEMQKEILLRRLRSQRESSDVGLWEQYLRLFDGSVKEAQISTSKFDRIGKLKSNGVFDRRATNGDEDQHNAVARFLKTLPPIQQKILHMTYWGGLSVRQIATILKLPRSTVSRWKNQAISEMRQKSGTDY